MKYYVTKGFMNFEKEEKYLNDMANKGFAFTDYSFYRYSFEPCERGEYIYRIELLDNLPTHPESVAYIKFLEEAGIECIATYTRWIYLRKKASDGPFDIYSDIGSRIRHYERVNTLWLSVAIVEFVAGICNLIIGIIDLSNRNYISALNLTFGTILILLGFVFIYAGTPSRRRLKELKKEKEIRE